MHKWNNRGFCFACYRDARIPAVKMRIAAVFTVWIIAALVAVAVVTAAVTS